MESLLSFLESESILLDVEAGTMSELFGSLCQNLVDRGLLEPASMQTLCDALIEREKLGSTALLEGVALPHAYVPGVKKEAMVFCRLASPISFQGSEAGPLSLVILLTGPNKNPSLHLKVLAKVARLLRDPDLLQELKSVQSLDDFIQAIHHVESRHGCT